MDWQPIIIAVAAAITAVTPILVLWVGSHVNAVHTIVNSQHTALVAKLAATDEQLAALQAAVAGRGGLVVIPHPAPLEPRDTALSGLKSTKSI
jgi:hypothetical protein